MILTEILVRWIVFSIIGTIFYEILIGKSGPKKSFLWLIANLVFTPIMILGQLYLWKSYHKNQSLEAKVSIKEKEALKISYAYTFSEFLFMFFLTYCIFNKFTLWGFIFSILFTFSNSGYILYSLSRYKLFIKIGYIINIVVLAYISTHL